MMIIIQHYLPRCCNNFAHIKKQLSIYLRKYMDDKKIIKRSVVILLAVIMLVMFSFGVGVFTIQQFQNRGRQEAYIFLEKYFAERGEKITRYISADYSIDVLEIWLITDKAAYSFDFGITNSWFVQFSFLNLIVTPKMKLLRIDPLSPDQWQHY